MESRGSHEQVHHCLWYDESDDILVTACGKQQLKVVKVFLLLPQGIC